MFGRTKKLSINDKEIVIRELKVREIKEMKDIITGTVKFETDVKIVEGAVSYFIDNLLDSATDESRNVLEVDGGSVRIEGKNVGEIIHLKCEKSKSPEEFMLVIAEKVAGISKDDIDELYPSQIEEIVDAVKEVNKGFLNLLGKVGIKMEDFVKSVETAMTA